MAAYLQLEKFITDGKLVLASEIDCLQWHCLLRDFSSMLQLVRALDVA